MRPKKADAARSDDNPIDEQDSPWKEALERYFPDFMEFFFPGAFSDIDWARGYEFLDKELQQIVRDADIGRRLVDKLIKVWRNDGLEAWVLIHVEVQGKSDTDFEKRMYVYNYRLYDRYDRPVASLAVLADAKTDWRPDQFEYELWGCRVSLRFPVAKLADYAARWQELEANNSPFAVIVMAHLKAQATRRNPQSRMHWKTYIVKHLYSRGYSRQDILELFRFIDWVMVLPEGLSQRFDAELSEFEENTKMPYVTSTERNGIKKGTLAALRESVLDNLEVQFGSVPPVLAERINTLDDIPLLKTLRRRAITAASLSEFEQSLDS